MAIGFLIVDRPVRGTETPMGATLSPALAPSLFLPLTLFSPFFNNMVYMDFRPPLLSPLLTEKSIDSLPLDAQLFDVVGSSNIHRVL